MAPSDEDKIGKTLIPDYPSERPDKQAFDLWFAKSSTVLTQNGYGSLVRGEVPYELRKLAPRPLLPVPADAAGAASANSKNDEIVWQNKVNADDLQARTQEIETRMGATLWHAFQKNAKLTWDGLSAAHGIKDGAGVVILGSHTGFRRLERYRRVWRQARRRLDGS